MTRVFYNVFLNVIPIVLMIGLIPLVENDFLLTGIYAGIIVVSFFIRYGKNDIIFLVFGLCVLTVSEYFFISTGVEVFERHTLLGVMPMWLPVLWGYAFVAIRRSIVILEDYLK
ncbi:MAG: hypothetical protein Q7S08_00110 [bacterium]|nr:hypothetical protein [bacterium]